MQYNKSIKTSLHITLFFIYFLNYHAPKLLYSVVFYIFQSLLKITIITLPDRLQCNVSTQIYNET